MSVLDVCAWLFVLGGCVMSFGAALGLLRFPDVLTRLHAGSKPQSFGLLLLLLGLGLAAREWSLVPMLVLVWAMQLLAVPVSSHMVGRSGYRNKHFRASSLSHNELQELVEQMSQEDQDGQETGSAGPRGEVTLDDAPRGSEDGQ